MAKGSPDFADDDNIFSDDYQNDSLFDEEDEEIGNLDSDFHEIDLGNPDKANREIEEYKKQPHLEDVPSKKKKPRKVGKMSAKMKKKGYISVVIELADKILILK